MEYEDASENKSSNIGSNKARLKDLKAKLLMLEDQLKNRTNSALLNNEMVKDFHFYKTKQYEIMDNKLK
eukprot:CAMPEP_0170546950 /NCGR_PEP_ID=MMETSP0211-20121228/5318_1 /TAXON_ID=311385 /ORGANISM="Pseudokeronopsis sp., Strain OXSARD2" /LENGTH=68 /DNA_ID=CAMNT_0010851685 /DNA_START=1621 /DNA_END=1827 /DNA_ORIENTATION=+